MLTLQFQEIDAQNALIRQQHFTIPVSNDSLQLNHSTLHIYITAGHYSPQHLHLRYVADPSIMLSLNNEVDFTNTKIRKVKETDVHEVGKKN